MELGIPNTNDFTEQVGLLKMRLSLLERQSANTQMFLLSTHLGVAFYDNHWHHRFINPAYEKIFSYSCDELMDRTLLDLIQQGQDSLHRILGLSVNPVIENHVVRMAPVLTKNGDALLCRIEIIVFTENAQNTYSAAAIVEDVTEQQQTDTVLRCREREFRKFIEHAHDVIFTTDVQGILTSLNPLFENLTGWAISEWLGRPFTQLIHPADLEYTLRCFGELVQGIPQKPIDLRVLCKNGDAVTFEVKASAQNEKRNCIGIWGIARDITARKREEEVMQSAARLEATATLAGGIAHDLNNLMLIVVGNAELLYAKSEGNMEARQKLKEITRSAYRASELASQLIAYARGGKIMPQPLSLNQVVDRIVKETSSLFTQRIRLESELETDLYRIQADYNQMAQVVRNLLINAVEAIPESGLVRLSTRNLEIGEKQHKQFPNLKMGSYIMLTVEDNGAGMDANTLSHIFEPFFTTKFQGRGLGLAAVYGIVMNHGGDIQVRSEEGLGACIRIFLPTDSQKNK